MWGEGSSNYKYCGLLFFCWLVSNGQTCTSPVYNNSVGVTIRGPCPSSQVFVAFTSNSTVNFTCSFDHDGSYLTFWKVTDIPINLQFCKKHLVLLALCLLVAWSKKLLLCRMWQRFRLCKFVFCTKDFCYINTSAANIIW